MNADGIEYFDSLGKPPSGDIEHFLNSYAYYKFSNVKIQSDNSISCGQFCLYYIYLKSSFVIDIFLP